MQWNICKQKDGQSLCQKILFRDNEGSYQNCNESQWPEQFLAGTLAFRKLKQDNGKFETTLVFLTRIFQTNKMFLLLSALPKITKSQEVLQVTQSNLTLSECILIFVPMCNLFRTFVTGKSIFHLRVKVFKNEWEI